MEKLKIKFLVLLLIALGLGFFFRNEIFDFYSKLTAKLPGTEKEITGLVKEELKKEEIKKEVFLPPPLRAKKEYPEAFLTQAGVIKLTNIEREKYGLPPLEENAKLTLSAAIKVEDMFENQYFSHYSPSGQNAGDFVSQAGYEFILIGENLALGNFQNDELLVQSWMESSGHRENILNPRYQEIGVAVKKGVFEGKMTWMAVQHFGLPLSVCSQPEEGLKTEIEEKEKRIEEIARLLADLQIEIRTFRPKRDEEYVKKAEEYNNLVGEYNTLIEELQSLVANYNHQVELFNTCLSGQ